MYLYLGHEMLMKPPSLTFGKENGLLLRICKRDIVTRLRAFNTRYTGQGISRKRR